MNPLRICLEYLESIGIRYRHVSTAHHHHHHDHANNNHNHHHTRSHDSGEDDLLASTVVQTAMLKGDGRYLLVAIPAESYVEIGKVRSAIGVSSLCFATEGEINDLFPHSDTDVLPPLSGLIGVPVFLDHELIKEPSVAFHAGSKRDMLHVRTEDLKRLPSTTVGALSSTDYQMEFRHRMLSMVSAAGR